MALLLKQSTAVDVKIGPFLDETDGKTAETGLTLTQPDIRLAKNGGNWAQKSAAQTLSHEENGYYECALSSTDTDTLGILKLAVHESGALPVWHDFMVVTANVYDSLVDGSDLLDVSVTQLAGSAISQASGLINANVTQISGDSTSADNLESYTDGTTPMPVNATQISGDSGAADNLESAYDGAGYAGGTIKQIVDVGALSGDTAAADNAESFFDGTGYAGTNNTIPTVTTVGTTNDLGATARGRVNTEVLDVLTVDTFAEPVSVPAATASLKDKINWLFALGRNKITQTSSAQAVRNDADSGTIGTAGVSDDGSTFTREEWS